MINFEDIIDFLFEHKIAAWGFCVGIAAVGFAIVIGFILLGIYSPPEFFAGAILIFLTLGLGTMLYWELFGD